MLYTLNPTQTFTASISYAITRDGLVDGICYNTPFTIESGGSGVVNIHQVGTINIPFVLQSTQTMSMNIIGSGAVSIKIESSGSSSLDIIGTGDISFEIETSGALAGDITGSGLTTDILFDLVGLGTLTINGVVVHPTTTIDAWIINGLTGGHACFLNYSFNSFFKLGDTYYGASDLGLFQLDGTTDNSTLIDSYIAVPESDFGVSKKKNIADVYTNIRVDGEAQVRLTTNEQQDRTGYPLYSNDKQGLHQRRVKTAKGIHGTNWQIELRNVDGSQMDVSSITVNPSVLKRNI